MVLGTGKSSQWIHNPDSLVNGRITYSVKFLGKAEVPEPRGMEMVKAALQKLNFSRQIKRTEGTKPPKVELSININNVTISNIKTKETWHDIALHRVSFCADDKTDKRLFAFIAKLDDNKHYCYGLDSVHQANDITLTIGQAFEIAYEKFMKKNPSAPSSKKVNDMSKRIKELESENDKLRKRIAELENAANGRPAHERADTTPMSSQLFASSTTPERSANLDAGSVAVPRSASPRTTDVTSPEMIDPFNMRPFVPTIPQPPSRGTRLVAMQANPFPAEPFAPAPHSGVSPKDILDMQNPEISRCPLSPIRGQRNAPAITRPPTRKNKKQRRRGAAGTRWSGKYFPRGRCKRKPASKGGGDSAEKARQLAVSAFGTGLAVSDGSFTLDAFDPLKH